MTITTLDTPSAEPLLDWYDRHHRDLPWRVSPGMAARGVRADPYRVWLSEVMLQQTTVQAVKPYFEKFLRRWPDVTDLAAAENDEVMAAWAGLGYYARARNLKKCAEAVAREHGGVFPDTEEGLKSLPGIGDYTAAAVAAIAFNRQAAVMDGNVERVISRLYAIEAPLPGAKPLMKEKVALLTPPGRPGDFAQAMMDLGATICTPKRPACSLCPFRDACQALKMSDPELFPVKAAKKEKPVRRGAAFIAVTAEGEILLRRRADSGLLGGMTEVPTTAWTARLDGETSAAAAPFAAAWQASGTVTHIFTHFELRLSIWRTAIADKVSTNDGWWEPVTNLEAQALPTVMKKAIAAAIPLAFKTSRA
ncbi:A/G-specific adenine glycosylase [Rhizobium lentis]|uniref:A/G-specific adenine glycosylase n=1 Tax=Rhizobium lentis TaxID=1138194 RepID=UPI001C83CBC4|nr:A/G-specific adenine glycosylase [Rhizobium lentis]MBX4976230.1 A/G-specific adenine glycosylase [Rhizobium lentis]MBX5086838.1 A/G-specific adenine glycosylase [Rhizobium lentis]MBX5099483.1 A/G-specific adenine glycosylase [Rhizobium lentis]MBX5123958.1 A/G-specific adenine glycosylase [Rhizobium lentis]MBX5130660.1 A/G-specific adenine glycosylase [Rhizobium lentis]